MPNGGPFKAQRLLCSINQLINQSKRKTSNVQNLSTPNLARSFPTPLNFAKHLQIS
jgi:hypothetical protein